MTGLLDEAGTRWIETRRFPAIGKRYRTVTGEFEVVNVEPPRANWSLEFPREILSPTRLRTACPSESRVRLLMWSDLGNPRCRGKCPVSWLLLRTFRRSRSLDRV